MGWDNLIHLEIECHNNNNNFHNLIMDIIQIECHKIHLIIIYNRERCMIIHIHITNSCKITIHFYDYYELKN